MARSTKQHPRSYKSTNHKSLPGHMTESVSCESPVCDNEVKKITRNMNREQERINPLVRSNSDQSLKRKQKKWIEQKRRRNLTLPYNTYTKISNPDLTKHDDLNKTVPELQNVTNQWNDNSGGKLYKVKVCPVHGNLVIVKKNQKQKNTKHEVISPSKLSKSKRIKQHASTSYPEHVVPHSQLPTSPTSYQTDHRQGARVKYRSPDDFQQPPADSAAGPHKLSDYPQPPPKSVARPQSHRSPNYQQVPVQSVNYAQTPAVNQNVYRSPDYDYLPIRDHRPKESDSVTQTDPCHLSQDYKHSKAQTGKGRPHTWYYDPSHDRRQRDNYQDYQDINRRPKSEYIRVEKASEYAAALNRSNTMPMNSTWSNSLSRNQEFRSPNSKNRTLQSSNQTSHRPGRGVVNLERTNHKLRPKEDPPPLPARTHDEPQLPPKEFDLASLYGEQIKRREVSPTRRFAGWQVTQPNQGFNMENTYPQPAKTLNHAYSPGINQLKTQQPGVGNSEQDERRKAPGSNKVKMMICPDFFPLSKLNTTQRRSRLDQSEQDFSRNNQSRSRTLSPTNRYNEAPDWLTQDCNRDTVDKPSQRSNERPRADYYFDVGGDHSRSSHNSPHKDSGTYTTLTTAIPHTGEDNSQHNESNMEDQPVMPPRRRQKPPPYQQPVQNQSTQSGPDHMPQAKNDATQAGGQGQKHIQYKQTDMEGQRGQTAMVLAHIEPEMNEQGSHYSTVHVYRSANQNPAFQRNQPHRSSHNRYNDTPPWDISQLQPTDDTRKSLDPEYFSQPLPKGPNRLPYHRPNEQTQEVAARTRVLKVDTRLDSSGSTPQSPITSPHLDYNPQTLALNPAHSQTFNNALQRDRNLFHRQALQKSSLPHKITQRDRSVESRDRSVESKNYDITQRDQSIQPWNNVGIPRHNVIPPRDQNVESRPNTDGIRRNVIKDRQIVDTRSIRPHNLLLQTVTAVANPDYNTPIDIPARPLYPSNACRAPSVNPSSGSTSYRTSRSDNSPLSPDFNPRDFNQRYGQSENVFPNQSSTLDGHQSRQNINPSNSYIAKPAYDDHYQSLRRITPPKNKQQTGNFSNHIEPQFAHAVSPHQINNSAFYRHEDAVANRPTNYQQNYRHAVEHKITPYIPKLHIESVTMSDDDVEDKSTTLINADEDEVFDPNAVEVSPADSINADLHVHMLGGKASRRIQSLKRQRDEKKDEPKSRETTSQHEQIVQQLEARTSSTSSVQSGLGEDILNITKMWKNLPAGDSWSDKRAALSKDPIMSSITNKMQSILHSPDSNKSPPRSPYTNRKIIVKQENLSPKHEKELPSPGSVALVKREPGEGSSDDLDDLNDFRKTSNKIISSDKLTNQYQSSSKSTNQPQPSSKLRKPDIIVSKGDSTNETMAINRSANESESESEDSQSEHPYKEEAESDSEEEEADNSSFYLTNYHKDKDKKTPDTASLKQQRKKITFSSDLNKPRPTRPKKYYHNHKAKPIGEPVEKKTVLLSTNPFRNINDDGNNKEENEEDKLLSVNPLTSPSSNDEEVERKEMKTPVGILKRSEGSDGSQLSLGTVGSAFGSCLSIDSTEAGMSRAGSYPLLTLTDGTRKDFRMSFNDNDVDDMGDLFKVSRKARSEGAASEPDSTDSDTDDDSTPISCKCCHTKQPLYKARLIYKMCHGCYTYYCSSDCRRADWSAHKPLCIVSRLSSLCKKIFKSVSTDQQLLTHCSKFSRTGYLCEGRGAVILSFSSPRKAQLFLSNAAKVKESALYINIKDLIKFTFDDKRERDSLIETCKRYNPEEKFVLHIAIKVTRNTNITQVVEPRMRGGEFHKHARIRLAEKVHQNNSQIDHEDTLILTAMSSHENERSADVLNVKDREVYFASVQTKLRKRGISLRHQYPDVYNALCQYVTTGKPFCPISLFAFNLHTQKRFLCCLMSQSHPENTWMNNPHLLTDLNLLPSTN